MNQILLELPHPLGPIMIRCQLPFTSAARQNVEAQLADIPDAFVSLEHKITLLERLDWLPQTEDQMKTAAALHHKGVNWHDAYAHALGRDWCACPDCAKHGAKDVR